MELVLVVGYKRYTPSWHMPHYGAVITPVVDIGFKLISGHIVDNVVIPNNPFQSNTGQVLWCLSIEANSLYLDGRVANVAVPQNHVSLALRQKVSRSLILRCPGIRTHSSQTSIKVMIDIHFLSISDPTVYILHVDSTNCILSCSLISGLWMPAM